MRRAVSTCRRVQPSSLNFFCIVLMIWSLETNSPLKLPEMLGTEDEEFEKEHDTHSQEVGTHSRDV